MTQEKAPRGVALHNLLEEIPAELDEETTSVLLSRPAVRIERILSSGQSSPPGFWYDQDADEWVLLFAGHARIAFEDGTTKELRAGDYLFLPARCRHRVAWTDPERVTVWLAVHCVGER